MEKPTKEFIEIIYKNLFGKDIEDTDIVGAFEKIKEKIFNVKE